MFKNVRGIDLEIKNINLDAFKEIKKKSWNCNIFAFIVLFPQLFVLFISYFKHE